MTPTFSRWLSDDDIFLRPALARLFGASDQSVCCSGASKSLNVLVAVVDRLNLLNQITETNAREVTSSRNGYEGVGYFLTDRQDIRVELDEAQQESPERQLVFNFSSYPTNVTKARIQRYGSVSSYSSSSTTIKLPLANTIFQTGQLATLRQSEWYLSDKAPGWHREATRELSSASLTWPPTAPLHMRNLSKHLVIQLVPLTVPREVEASMGNIVRNLRNESTPIPASKELEVSISDFFRTRGIPPHTLSVWALISPASALDSDKSDSALQAIRDNWAGDLPDISQNIISALSKGARLHRVLSGGGGWGKKAGLLALDPGDYRSSKTEAEDENSIEDLDEEEALTQVARPGDFIQFFITPPALKKPPPKIQATYTRRKASIQQLSIGVVPSSINDRLPDHTSRANETAQFSVSRGGCKILTESALNLQLEYGGDVRRTYASKLDVPYAFMTYRAYPAPLGGGDVKQFLSRPQSTPVGNGSGVGPVIQKRDYSKYLISVAFRGSKSGMQNESCSNGSDAHNRRSFHSPKFRQVKSAREPTEALPLEITAANDSQSSFTRPNRASATDDNISACHGRPDGRDKRALFRKTRLGFPFRKVRLRFRDIIRQWGFHKTPYHHRIYKTSTSRIQHSRVSSPTEQNSIREIRAHRSTFQRFVQKERDPGLARPKKVVRVRKVAGSAADTNRQVTRSSAATRASPDPPLRRIKIAGGPAFRKFILKGGDLRTARASIVVGGREIAISAADTERHAVGSSAAARALPELPLRRVRVSDERDEVNAWNFFEELERGRGREQQRGLTPAYAARISHHRKNRREGPIARARLEDSDWDGVVNEDGADFDHSTAARGLIW